VQTPSRVPCIAQDTLFRRNVVLFFLPFFPWWTERVGFCAMDNILTGSFAPRKPSSFFVITFIYALCLRLQRIYGGERSNMEVIEHSFLQTAPAPVDWLPWYKRAKSLKCIAWSLSGRRTRSWSLESGNKLSTTIQYGMFVSSSSKRGPICNMCEHRDTLSQPTHGIVISMSFIAMFTNTSDAYEGNAMRART
jgi:hypothetical protein